MHRRLVLIPAICAALLGAPSVVSGAGNELVEAEAWPASGTTSTLFTLQVGYIGRAPATGVEAQVAGRSVSMTLVSGSPIDGTWLAVTRLPAGSWPVVYAATAERGNHPTLLGPTLSVLDPTAPQMPSATAGATTEPSRRPSAQREHVGSTTTPGGGESPSDPSTPAAAATEPGGPEPTAAPEAAPASAEHDGTAAVDPPSGEPLGGSPAAGASGGSGASGPPASGGPGGGATGAPGQASAAADARVPNPAPPAHGRVASDEDGRTDAAAPIEEGAGSGPADEAATGHGLAGMGQVVGAWLAAFLVALAAIAVTVSRRRSRTAEAEASLLAAQTTALLERRALRRGRIHLEEDPIVAALGIGDEPSRRQALRAPRDDETGGADPG